MSLLRGILRSMRRTSDCSDPVSVDEWNRVRSCHMGRAPDESSRVHEVLRSSSWLALVCFAESVDPNSLGLSSERSEAVREEIVTLRAHDALELYVGCLERLADTDTRRSEERTC